MSTIAVFLVIGGASALAASQLGKNTVGTKQLKKSAVNSAKVKAGAITGEKIAADAITGDKVKDASLTGADIVASTLGVVPNATNAINATKAANAVNAANAANAANAVNAVNAANAAHADSATSAASPEPLASGKTETGVFYAIETVGTGSSGFVGAAISFTYPLAAAPVQNYRKIGSTPNAACPGTAADPQAAPGNLCAYETVNGTGNEAFLDGAASTVRRFGSGVAASSSGDFNDDLIGTWAVTAP
jgi:hypothetical protein